MEDGRELELVEGTVASLIFQNEENGYTIAGAPRESYIDGIWNKDSEEEWLTEIQIPAGR